MVVTNKTTKPPKKHISAIDSKRSPTIAFERMERNENIQAAINNTEAPIVNSSIIVLSDVFKTFREVSTTKQMPNKLEAAFNT